MKEGLEQYEIACVLRSEAVLDDIKRLLAEQGGVINAVRAPLRTRLAYPIEEVDTGYFAVLGVSLPTSVIAPIKKAAGLHRGILRFDLSRADRGPVPPLARVPQEESSVPPAEQRSVAAEVRRPERPYPRAELSNEALEEKLKEILQ